MKKTKLSTDAKSDPRQAQPLDMYRIVQGPGVVSCYRLNNISNGRHISNKQHAQACS